MNASDEGGSPPRPELDQEAPEPERSPFTLVAQFFLIPLLVVAVTVGLFLSFGLLTRDRRTPSEYLEDVRSGSMNRRWQAAYELSVEMSRRPELVKDDELFAGTLKAFVAAKSDSDPQVRRYLALALGRFGREEAVAALVEALGDEDEETRLYATLALGGSTTGATTGTTSTNQTTGKPAAPRSGAAVGPLIAVLQAQEPTLRKAAALSLGTLGDRTAIPALRITADDPREDVALQGALALAQLGDASGLPALRRSIEPGGLGVEVAMRPEQLSEALSSAIRGLVLLRDAESLPRLKEMAQAHEDLRVRAAALAAQDAIGQSR